MAEGYYCRIVSMWQNVVRGWWVAEQESSRGTVVVRESVGARVARGWR